MKKKVILGFVVLAFFSSCTNRKNEHSEIKYLYYDNGNIRKEIHLKNGIPEGLATFFYGDNSIEAIGYFKNGKAEGKWIRYYQSNIISTIESYKSGIREGVCYVFFPSGYLQTIWHFHNDSLYGDMVNYYDHRDMVHECFPKMEPDGNALLEIIYDTLGKPTFLKQRDNIPMIKTSIGINKINTE